MVETVLKKTKEKEEVRASRKDIVRLRRIVWTYYKKHGRHDLPWRKTHNPYRILVSEVMLQQTQVVRVLPKYRSFLRTFPTVQKLAEASLRDVLVKWQGLGYNRRAKMLHDAAKTVVSDHGGSMPKTYVELVRLPGVGEYTASAVCAFAYNQPVNMVETNIRTVLFHHLFGEEHIIPDGKVLQVAAMLCPRGRTREWYWALMDYGAFLKEQGVRVNSKSKHYTKQSKFEGSDRQVRGAILRTLTNASNLTEKSIIQKTKAAPKRVREQLEKMKKEGMVQCHKCLWSV